MAIIPEACTTRDGEREIVVQDHVRQEWSREVLACRLSVPRGGLDIRGRCVAEAREDLSPAS